jgi:hypothetical protein
MNPKPLNLIQTKFSVFSALIILLTPAAVFAQGSGHTGGGGGVLCTNTPQPTTLKVLEAWELDEGKLLISDHGLKRLRELSALQNEKLVLDLLLAGLQDAPLFMEEVSRRAQKIGPVDQWPKIPMENAFEFKRLTKLPTHCSEVVLAGWFDGDLYQNSLYALESPAQRAFLWFHEAVTSFLVERGIQDPVLVRGLFKSALEWDALSKNRPNLLSTTRYLTNEERMENFMRARQSIARLLVHYARWQDLNPTARQSISESEIRRRLDPAALIQQDSIEKWTVVNELQASYAENVLRFQDGGEDVAEEQLSAAIDYLGKAMVVLQRVLGPKAL